MKQLIFFFSLLLMSSYSNAQISAEEMYVGVFPPKNPDAPERMDRWMVDLFHDEWTPVPAGIKISPWSSGVSVSRMLDLPLNKKSSFALAIGIGFSSHNVLSNGQITTTIDSAGKEFTHLTPFAGGYEYEKNKLSLNYVEVPVQIRFRTNKKHTFFFYPGAKLGYLFNSHTKTIDNDGKYKVYNIKGLEKLQYGATVHLGFNRLAIYGYYGLSNVFAKDKGDAFTAFSIGLSLNFF